MNIDGVEIERRFLIEMPPQALLAQGETSEISQTYLLGEPGVTERVRLRRCGDECAYTHTVKRKLNNLRRLEDEKTVGEKDYQRLLLRADPKRRTIEKKRCCLLLDGLLWELDIFPFWEDRAILELELSDERQPFTLPDCFHLIREVTDDPRYSNAALSLALADGKLP